ncbi:MULTISPECIES: hypothetical protein [unclassified Actinoplanes]|uniref:hypothetical protein n=1 Tax=unclassified Actinoplanes TaxID=2626549 RepID=UPI0005BCBA0F|nr:MULTISPECIES: hypothetical protein [unclassified Actinoplanes]
MQLDAPADRRGQLDAAGELRGQVRQEQVGGGPSFAGRLVETSHSTYSGWIVIGASGHRD